MGGGAVILRENLISYVKIYHLQYHVFHCDPSVVSWNIKEKKKRKCDGFGLIELFINNNMN